MSHCVASGRISTRSLLTAGAGHPPKFGRRTSTRISAPTRGFTATIAEYSRDGLRPRIR